MGVYVEFLHRLNNSKTPHVPNKSDMRRFTTEGKQTKEKTQIYEYISRTLNKIAGYIILEHLYLTSSTFYHSTSDVLHQVCLNDSLVCLQLYNLPVKQMCNST